MTGGTAPGMGGAVDRAALAAALGSAVLDVLTERGIVADANVTGCPRTGGRAPADELELRRKRWVTTSATYLGAAAADPVTVLSRMLGAPGRGAGHQSGPGPEVREGEPMDPALLARAHELLPESTDYAGEPSPNDEVRFGYGD